MTQDETQLLSSWRTLPDNERKQYLRRITALSMVYRDPVPDERTGKLIKAAPEQRRRKTVKA